MQQKLVRNALQSDDCDRNTGVVVSYKRAADVLVPCHSLRISLSEQTEPFDVARSIEIEIQKPGKPQEVGKQQVPPHSGSGLWSDYVQTGKSVHTFEFAVLPVTNI
jgi:hypothetical protein